MYKDSWHMINISCWCHFLWEVQCLEQIQPLTLRLLALSSPSFHFLSNHWRGRLGDCYMSFLHHAHWYLSQADLAHLPRGVATTFIQSRDKRVNLAVPFSGEGCGCRLGQCRGECQ